MHIRDRAVSSAVANRDIAMSHTQPTADEELRKLVLGEIRAFNYDVSAWRADGKVPTVCVHTQLNRRLEILRRVVGRNNTYEAWRTISELVETWSEHDLWVSCIAEHCRSSPGSSASEGPMT